MKRFSMALGHRGCGQRRDAPATAFAHAEFKSTYPGKGKTASTRITTVSVTFTAAIRRAR